MLLFIKPLIIQCRSFMRHHNAECGYYVFAFVIIPFNGLNSMKIASFTCDSFHVIDHDFFLLSMNIIN